MKYSIQSTTELELVAWIVYSEQRIIVRIMIHTAGWTRSPSDSVDWFPLSIRVFSFKWNFCRSPLDTLSTFQTLCKFTYNATNDTDFLLNRWKLKNLKNCTYILYNTQSSRNRICIMFSVGFLQRYTLVAEYFLQKTKYVNSNHFLPSYLVNRSNSRTVPVSSSFLM